MAGRRLLPTLLATLALAALAAPVAPGAPSRAVTGPAKATKSWQVRWPGVHKTRFYTLRMPVGEEWQLDLTRIGFFVGGVRIEPDGYDAVVACAHRNPSFAAAQFSKPKADLVLFKLELESGECIGPGRRTAGRRVTIRAVLYYD